MNYWVIVAMAEMFVCGVAVEIVLGKMQVR